MNRPKHVRADSAAAWLFIAALATPPLVKFGFPPTASAFNDAAALVGWGLFAAALAACRLRAPLCAAPSAAAVLGVRYICGWGAAFIVFTGLQIFVAGFGNVSAYLAHSGLLACALGIAVLAVYWADAERNADASDTVHSRFALALLSAASASALVGWIQYLLPSADVWGVSPLATEGRIFGNVRQPNHLALILAWGVAACVWLFSSRRIPVWGAACAIVFITPVLILTGSRMARLLLLVLPLISLFFPRTRNAFGFAVFAAVIGSVTWFAAEYAQAMQWLPFFGAARNEDGTHTGLRAELWSNAIAMIPQVPATGCGVGQFNFCWTHADVSGRVPGHWIHPHNIVLHWFVELGVAATILFLFGLLYPLLTFRGWDRWRSIALPLTILVYAGVHALLEFPLSYAYFLLPVSFSFGLILLESRRFAGDELTHRPSATVKPFRSGAPVVACVGAALIGAGLLYGGQYWALRQLYHSPYAKQKLSVDELAALRAKTWLFRAHVDYSLLMVLTDRIDPNDTASSYDFFKRFANENLDGRLLSRFAVLAAIAGDSNLSLHCAWRVYGLYPNDFKNLKTMLATEMDPRLAVLREFANNPRPHTVPLAGIRALAK